MLTMSGGKHKHNWISKRHLRFFFSQHKYMYILCGQARTHTHTFTYVYAHVPQPTQTNIWTRMLGETHTRTTRMVFRTAPPVYSPVFRDFIAHTCWIPEKSYLISEVWISLLSRSDTINIVTVQRTEMKSSALCVCDLLHSTWLFCIC